MRETVFIICGVLFAACAAISLIWMMRNLVVSFRSDGMKLSDEPEVHVRRSMSILLKPFLFFLASGATISLVMFVSNWIFGIEATS